jgi:hypothetical protein
MACAQARRRRSQAVVAPGLFRASWRTECAKHSTGLSASLDGLHGTIHFYPEEDKISIF